MCVKKPLVILTGPTAVGKTKLSIALAKAIHGEIISADSMQVYRKMNIGTAKIRPEEMKGVSHHLIDIMDPFEDFNVFTFQRLATKAMEEIYSRGNIPIITGGTGFYIQSVLYDIDFTENENDTSYRDSLYEKAEKEGAESVHALLQQVDPDYALSVHANNVKRVIRALEYYHQTGQKMSEHNEEQHQKESPYNFLYFVLNDKREHLYERIDLRVDQMMEEGLEAEVRSLVNEGYTKDLVSMKGLGYKELIDYIQGETTLEETVYILKRDTRHFAKRQLTWFHREKDVTMVSWNDVQYDENKMLFKILDLLKEKGIIHEGTEV